MFLRITFMRMYFVFTALFVTMTVATEEPPPLLGEFELDPLIASPLPADPLTPLTMPETPLSMPGLLTGSDLDKSWILDCGGKDTFLLIFLLLSVRIGGIGGIGGGGGVDGGVDGGDGVRGRRGSYISKRACARCS